jgi:hypothetical protein
MVASFISFKVSFRIYLPIRRAASKIYFYLALPHQHYFNFNEPPFAFPERVSEGYFVLATHISTMRLISILFLAVTWCIFPFLAQSHFVFLKPPPPDSIYDDDDDDDGGASSYRESCGLKVPRKADWDAGVKDEYIPWIRDQFTCTVRIGTQTRSHNSFGISLPQRPSRAPSSVMVSDPARYVASFCFASLMSYHPLLNLNHGEMSCQIEHLVKRSSEQSKALLCL